jgi:hypothetical protein
MQMLSSSLLSLFHLLLLYPHETAAAAATARAREEKSIHFYLSIACIVQS